MERGTIVRLKNTASMFDGRLNVFEGFALPDMPNPAAVIRLTPEDGGPALPCHLDNLEILEPW